MNQAQIDAIADAVRCAVRQMGLDRIKAGEFFGMKQAR